MDFRHEPNIAELNQNFKNFHQLRREGSLKNSGKSLLELWIGKWIFATNLLGKPLAKLQGTPHRARGADALHLAREGQKPGFPTVFTANSGKTLSYIAAVKKLEKSLLCLMTEKSMGSLIALGVTPLKCLVIVRDNTVKRRREMISRVIYSGSAGIHFPRMIPDKNYQGIAGILRTMRKS